MFRGVQTGLLQATKTQQNQEKSSRHHYEAHPSYSNKNDRIRHP